MNSTDFNLNKELNVFGIFPDDLLDKLNKFSIFTIGQLLGATKGLTNIKGLFDTQEQLELLQELISIIPEEIQSEYENFTFRHSTGLIIPNTDDNEKENE